MDDNEQLSAEEQAQLDSMRAEEQEEQVEAPEQPEAQAEAPAAEQDTRPKMVPHAALHEERERAKEYKRQLEDERKARQTLEERTNLILQRLGQQPQPAQPPQQPNQPPPLPDKNQDPVGSLEARAQRAEEAAMQAIRALESRGQNDQQHQMVAAVTQQTAAMENIFRSEVPDYDAAAVFVRSSRDRELEMLGVANPVERQMLMAREAFDLSARALHTGKNPAQILYEYAKQRGYAPPQKQAAQPEVNLEERLQTINRGQQQARSLSNVRGAGPQGLSVNAIAAMDHDEFARWLDKASPSQMRHVFGGDA